MLLPTGLHKARTGALVPRQGPNQEIIPLPGMYFFDGWRVQPSLKIPDNLPQTQDMPVRIRARAPVEGAVPARQTPEEEARDILAAAVKNQLECGPGTRRAAVRAIKYLRTLVNNHKRSSHTGTFFLGGAICLSAGHQLLRLTCGPAGNRITTGSLSAMSKDTALPTSPQGRLRNLHTGTPAYTEE